MTARPSPRQLSRLYNTQTLTHTLTLSPSIPLAKPFVFGIWGLFMGGEKTVLLEYILYMWWPAGSGDGGLGLGLG